MSLHGSGAYTDLYGTVCQVSGTELKLALRSGRAFRSTPVERPYAASSGAADAGPLRACRLTIDKAGVAHAQKIAPAHMLSSD